MALKSYNHKDQHRLILFINNKLPLLDSKAHPRHGSHLCPSCQHQPEDARHFLECCHPARMALFQVLHQDLTTMSQQMRLHPCVLTTIWLGLNTIRTATQYPDILAAVLPPFRLPILQQISLRWEQIYYGRLSRTWAPAINASHPHLDKSGEHVMTLMVKSTWKFILDTWELRNQHLHNNAATLHLPNYQQAVMTLYKQKDRLPPAAQEALYQHPIEDILALPAPQLEQWVIRGHQYYNQQLKAAKKQASLQMEDIQKFFGPLAQQSDDPHPLGSPVTLHQCGSSLYAIVLER